MEEEAEKGSTPQEFMEWLAALTDSAKITSFVADIATDLKGKSLLNAAKYGENPTSLQKGQFTLKLANSKIEIADIPNGEEFAAGGHVHDKWWMEHGATVATRVEKAFAALGGGGGAMSEEMIRGKVLTMNEANVVVGNKSFVPMGAAVGAGDWVAAKDLADPKTDFGKLFTRAALHFKESGGKSKGQTAKDDFNRPALDTMLQAYATLWQGTVIMDIVRQTYTRRELFPQRMGEELHLALMAFADGAPFESGFTKALAMLVEVEVKDLPSCGHGALMKALGVVINILHAGMYKVGPTAAQSAQDVVEVWAFKDEHWTEWCAAYGGKLGEEPLNCIKKFVMPVMEKWLALYWKQLTASGETFKMKHRMEEALKITTMREDPNLGMRMYEERAAAIESRLSSSPLKRKNMIAAVPTEVAPDLCSHCKHAQCYKETCWKLHPELRPARRGQRGGQREQQRRGRAQGGGQQQQQQQQQQQKQYFPYSQQYEHKPQQQQQQQYQHNGHQQAQQMLALPPSPAWSQGPPPNMQSGMTSHSIGMRGSVSGTQARTSTPIPSPNSQQFSPRTAFIPMMERECYTCGKKGHIARECPDK